MARQLEFECPECRRFVKVPESFAGVSGKCPKCKETIRFPGERRRPKLEEGEDGEVPDEVKPAATRPCPACAETIVVYAARCPFCGESFRAARGSRSVGGAESLLKVWGLLIIALAALMLVAQLGGGARQGGGVLVGSLVMSIIIMRVGYGLMQLRRTAVVGCGALLALSLGIGGILVSIAPRSKKGGVILLALGGPLVVYLPPVVLGAMRWKELD